MKALKEGGSLAACAAALLLAGCNYLPKVDPYRMEIQQGNYVTQDMVAKLQPGMSREQVKFALGTPLVVDTFRDDRWDYVYLRIPENAKVPERRRISVIFENDKLARITGDVVTAPAPAPPAQGAAPATQGTAAPAAQGAAPPVAQNAPASQDSKAPP
ncbi:MAG TPA: outer membrane protein assembly factor BamE [Burkholderiales bacterium]|nr:outer membrane protein assembly factor BamE [Burkholderiales bacterium]